MGFLENCSFIINNLQNKYYLQNNITATKTFNRALKLAEKESGNRNSIQHYKRLCNGENKNRKRFISGLNYGKTYGAFLCKS
jgi:hypothetical protein